MTQQRAADRLGEAIGETCHEHDTEIIEPVVGVNISVGKVEFAERTLAADPALADALELGLLLLSDDGPKALHRARIGCEVHEGDTYWQALEAHADHIAALTAKLRERA